jgi:hypothetical protein
MTGSQLEKYGWRLISKKKRGMFRIILWLDAQTGLVLKQGEACRIQKERNEMKKSLLRADCVKS